MTKNKKTILNFEELDFSYDPIGSWKRSWENLDREYLFEQLSGFLFISETVNYKYQVFNHTFIKKPSDVTLCFDDGEQSTFIISQIERGRRQDISIHSNERTALADFLFRTLRKPSYEHSDIFKMIRRIPV